VGRGTVRRALQDLASIGVVYRDRAKGTFPVQRADIERPATLQLGGLIRYLEEEGMEPSSEVRDVRREVPTQQVREALRLGSDDTVLAFTRRVSARGEPISLSEIQLRSPASFAPSAVDLERAGSAITLLERESGFAVTRAEHRVWARGASSEEASALELGTGDPVLVVETVMSTREGAPVAFRRLVDRGEAIRHSFVTTTDIP